MFQIQLICQHSVILKTELARMFMEDIDLGVDKNLVITACLLCGCKKKKDATDINTIRSYPLKTELSALHLQRT